LIQIFYQFPKLDCCGHLPPPAAATQLNPHRAPSTGCDTLVIPASGLPGLTVRIEYF
jgi:hypothetical protein